MAEISSRAAAARALAEVLGQGRSLSTALPKQQNRLSAAQDRAFVQELCFGTLRWLPRLQALLRPLLRKPLKERDSDVQALLLVGLYQLLVLKTPAHAAVSETVKATASLKKPWARGLTNGVLRSALRREDELLAAAESDETARFAHPQWLIDTLRAAWPQQWERILTENNSHPPMVLRVNLRHQSREAYLQRLEAAGIEARALEPLTGAIVLATPVAVEALPGFGDGDVSVQDGAAQLAAELLAPQPGERILDACAAPGGKTGHLLERAETLQVVAVDRDGARLQRVAQNLGRLGAQAELVEADVGEPATWWDGRPFDRILLDAPCSATGVIRRHPDIKVLRRPRDIAELAAEQARLLRALWPLLKQGGMLLYATCSVLPQENSEQIERFLGEVADARAPAIDAAWGRAASVGRQILPGEDGMDGFYYARLVKI